MRNDSQKILTPFNFFGRYVYTDDGSGKPQYRVAVSEETAVNSTAGWQTIELIQPLQAEEGTTIWLSCEPGHLLGSPWGPRGGF